MEEIQTNYPPLPEGIELDEWLTLPRVAALLGVNRKAMWWRAQQGLLESKQMGPLYFTTWRMVQKCQNLPVAGVGRHWIAKRESHKAPKV